MEEWPSPFATPYVAEGFQTCCDGVGFPFLKVDSGTLVPAWSWIVATTEETGLAEDFGAIGFLKGRFESRMNDLVR